MMRCFRNKLPKVGELVMAKVTRSGGDSNSFYCELINYNMIEGFVSSTELKRKEKVRKLIEGKKEVVLSVVSIDTDKGYIDLSHRKFDKKSATQFELDYPFNKKIWSLGQDMKTLQKNNEFTEFTDFIYDQIIWPVYDKINNENNIKSVYENILLNPKLLFGTGIDNSIFSEEYITSIIDNIKSRVVLTPVQIEAEIQVTVIDGDGVDTIKKIFDYQIDNVSIEIVAPPIYRIIVDADNITNAIINLEKMALVIKENCEKYGAIHVKYVAHKVIRESSIRLEILKIN